MKNGKGERIGGQLEYTPMQNATRQGKILSFFLLKRKESCCKKKRRRGERREGEGEGGKCLTFFKGIINSLSALVSVSFGPAEHCPILLLLLSGSGMMMASPVS